MTKAGVDPPLSSDRDFTGAFGYLETGEGVLLVANERVIAGEPTLVWDLPGGHVESGETLSEALRREMAEETGLAVVVGDLLFVSEGERVRGGRRTSVWKSFFFRVLVEGPLTIRYDREPEILGHRFAPLDALPSILTAPYHGGFLTWLASGGERHLVFDRWVD